VDVQALVERELGDISNAPKCRPLRLVEFARLPIAKANHESEVAEFAATSARAEQKGNRAHALLHSPDCLPDPALVRKWAKDYEVSEEREMTKGKR